MLKRKFVNVTLGKKHRKILGMSVDIETVNICTSWEHKNRAYNIPINLTSKALKFKLNGFIMNLTLTVY